VPITGSNRKIKSIDVELVAGVQGRQYPVFLLLSTGVENPVELHVFGTVVIPPQGATKIHRAYFREIPGIIHRKPGKTGSNPRPAVGKHRFVTPILWIHRHLCNRQVVVYVQLDVTAVTTV